MKSIFSSLAILALLSAPEEVNALKFNTQNDDDMLLDLSEQSHHHHKHGHRHKNKHHKDAAKNATVEAHKKHHGHKKHHHGKTGLNQHKKHHHKNHKADSVHLQE